MLYTQGSHMSVGMASSGAMSSASEMTSLMSLHTTATLWPSCHNVCARVKSPAQATASFQTGLSGRNVQRFVEMVRSLCDWVRL
jgi:hypothetical protein